MADTKITALTALTGADPANDVIPIVDVSDTTMAASGTTKKISVNNILGASGTATLASATITGDLTVDTSTLYVSSSADKVGIGTTSLSNEKLTVAGNISANAWLGRSNISVPSGDCSIFRSADNTLGFGIASTTAMTLNSTGLGVGGSPSGKIHAQGTGVLGLFTQGAAPASALSAVTIQAPVASGFSSLPVLNFWYQNTGISNPASECFAIRTNSADRLYVDATGNVGIGVTPSAWGGAGVRVLDVGAAGSFAGSAADVGVVGNAYYNGSGWIYKTSFFSGRYAYALGTGQHQWFNAASGTAGNAITFTQAMTLDASGNLLVGKSSASATTIGFEGRANGTVNSTLASSVDANATYAAYSTGAAAYRFYVGMGGTVYATNTTISAISDARLKENVQDIDVGLGAILALKPRKFDWKEGKGKNIKGDRGFIAQEFEQVFPQLVDEWKDEAPEGETPYKSVRQDLIPVLVKAIQELAARVQTLETR